MNVPKQEVVSVILVAAGLGTRLGAGMPKALVEIAGKPLAHHALDRILNVPRISEIIVVTPPLDDRLTESLAGYPAKVRVVAGGDSRAASVRAGLAVVRRDATRILVHDAARAFAPAEVFERVLNQLDQPGCEAVIPARAVTDTISVVESVPDGDGIQVQSTPARANLRAVQTPQGFHADILRAAHARLDHLDADALAAVTDDASIVRDSGIDVRVVEGAEDSLKVTHAGDLHTVSALAGEASQQTTQRAEHTMPFPRVGTGIDVHAVSDDPSRPMWLAGLHFPEDVGLSGHSDGDAVAHAACDALFSASGIGDLGTHFGVDRPEFAGASGVSLLTEAARLVRAAGFEIGNIAVQFVGRRPRFGARREEANQVLSDAAGAPVSVTATTSDGLGYEGDGAGITAYATALVYPVPTGSDPARHEGHAPR